MRSSKVSVFPACAACLRHVWQHPGAVPGGVEGVRALTCRGTQLDAAAAYSPYFEFNEGVAPLVMSNRDDSRSGDRHAWCLVRDDVTTNPTPGRHPCLSSRMSLCL